MVNYIWRDGSRLTPWMNYQIDRLDHDFFNIWGCHIKVTSGIRLYDEQVAIFLARYVLAGDIRGRRVYDTRVWQGRRYYRISSAGTVAVPSTSNHEIQGTNAAVDLRDTGSNAGVSVMGSARANWLRANAWRYDMEPEGYNFNEAWHYKTRNIFNTPPNNAPAGGGGVQIPTEEEELMGAKEDINAHLTKEINRAISAVIREHRLRAFSSDDGKYAALGRFGQVIKLSSDPAIAKMEREAYAANLPLLLPKDELLANVKMHPTAFFSLVDRFDPSGRHGYGQFIQNTFELNGGSTKQVRTDVTLSYPSRTAVWADGRPVEITLDGKVISEFFVHNGLKSARFLDGTIVSLTSEQVNRADSQVAGNSQNWS